MSFWSYLTTSEKIKYAVLALIGGFIGTIVVILGITEKIESWIMLGIVFSIVVPICSSVMKLRISAYKRISPKKLSEKEKKDWGQIEKLIHSAKWSKKEKKSVFLIFVLCVLFALLCYLYISLRYPDLMRIISSPQEF